jgi:hypothetical protein
MNVESFYGQKCSIVYEMLNGRCFWPVSVLMSKIQKVQSLLKCSLDVKKIESFVGENAPKYVWD